MINISEDGKYFSGFDGKVHDDEGVDFWTDDWIWDNYHALHPLQIILNPADEVEKLTSYIRMYEHSGWMPTFPCVFGDAHCMNGNHAAAMFADALTKGLEFDVNKAYEGMRHRRGLPVRGQRTNRNARTRKGKGKVVANKKK